MDLLGQILWFAIFLTPLITIPIAWHLVKGKIIYRILLAIVLTIIASFILYILSLAILFRNGLGPT